MNAKINRLYYDWIDGWFGRSVDGRIGGWLGAYVGKSPAGIFRRGRSQIVDVRPLASEVTRGPRWMDGRMDGRTDGRTDGHMDIWTYGHMDGRTDGWMDGWMDGWTVTTTTIAKTVNYGVLNYFMNEMLLKAINIFIWNALCRLEQCEQVVGPAAGRPAVKSINISSSLSSIGSYSTNEDNRPVWSAGVRLLQ